MQCRLTVSASPRGVRQVMFVFKIMWSKYSLKSKRFVIIATCRVATDEHFSGWGEVQNVELGRKEVERSNAEAIKMVLSDSM